MIIKLFAAIVAQTGLITVISLCVVHYRDIIVTVMIDTNQPPQHASPAADQRQGLGLYCDNVTSLDEVSSVGLRYSYNVADPNRTASEFLADYQRYCRTSLTPNPSNWIKSTDCLCPCIPPGLVGFVSLEVDKHVPDVERGLSLPGGRWVPDVCQARQRIAIIVPFRDRHQHLAIFLRHMRALLKRQLVDFTIFVVEQVGPQLFNRASLMNVGFVEARSRGHFDCYFFHDVDVLPEDDRNMYTCSDRPQHLAGYLQKWNYTILYDCVFGGVNAFRQHDFETINGFGNTYYGWGGEDDDILRRIWSRNMTIDDRRPISVARYYMVPHLRDHGNPINNNSRLAYTWRPHLYDSDGLNSLNYELRSFRELKDYTHISVDLLRPIRNLSPSIDRYRFYSAPVKTSRTCKLSEQIEYFPKLRPPVEQQVVTIRPTKQQIRFRTASASARSTVGLVNRNVRPQPSPTQRPTTQPSLKQRRVVVQVPVKQAQRGALRK